VELDTDCPILSVLFEMGILFFYSMAYAWLIHQSIEGIFVGKLDWIAKSTESPKNNKNKIRDYKEEKASHMSTTASLPFSFLIAATAVIMLSSFHLKGNPSYRDFISTRPTRMFIALLCTLLVLVKRRH